MRSLVFAVAMACFTTGPAMSGDLIRSACLKSGRPAATRALCGCIQQVADLYFKQKDQKLAASFFKDPHKAQEIRQSDKRTHEVFWTRYKEFGAAAEDQCSG